MIFKALLRSVLLVAVVTGLFACSSDDDGNTTDVVESTSISSASTLKTDTVLIEGDSLQQVISSEVVENDYVRLELTDGGIVEKAVLGENLVILAGTDERYPLGLSGKIDSISNSEGGNKLITLSPLTFNDVVVESKSEIINIPLTGDHFIGAIAPDAIQGSSDSRARRSDASSSVSALGGGVVIQNSSSSIQGKSIFGDSGSISPGEVNLNLIVKLEDFFGEVKPKRLQPYGAEGKSELNVKGSIKNLIISEKHEKGANEKLESFELQVTGELEVSADITAILEGSLGYYSRAWNEVEKKQVDFLGISASYTGLDSKDKVGKYPLTGLVFSLECTKEALKFCGIKTGSTQTAIREAKPLGLIVWVYLNANGTITLEGSVGSRTNMDFSMGVKQDKEGELENTTVFKNPSNGKRVFEAPYARGKLQATANIGLSLDFDVFILGVRPISLGLDAVGRMSAKVESDSAVSYGFTRFGDDWSWEGGDVCVETTVGGGVIFSADVSMGIGLKTSWKDVSGKFAYHYQTPTEEELVTPGWHGLGDFAWYTGPTFNRCYPNMAAPEPIVEAGNKSATLRWDEKGGITYDVCISKQSILSASEKVPVTCSSENEGQAHFENKNSPHTFENLNKDVLYHFAVIAKRRDERKQSAEVLAIPFGDAVIVDAPEVTVSEVGDSKFEVSWTDVEGADFYVVCKSESSIADNLSGSCDQISTSPTEFVGNQAQNGIKYFVRVMAVVEGDPQIQGPLSNEVTAQPIATIVPVEISIDIGGDITLQENTSLDVPRQFNVAGITSSSVYEVVCITTLDSLNLTNTKSSFNISPSSISGALETANVVCSVYVGTELKASDEITVTVTKTPNQAPKVSLSGGSLPHGKAFEVKPVVSDDDLLSIRYSWKVEWTGDKENLGSPTSVSAAVLTSKTLILNIPEMLPGEKGSVKVTLEVTDGEGISDEDSSIFTYQLDKVEELGEANWDFTDGDTLERGSKPTLSWTVKNVGNVDLIGVNLSLSTQKADKLNVGDISPAYIALWKEGETKTFEVTVEVPNDVVEGTHEQEWYFSHNGAERTLLPYRNTTEPAYLNFEFLTADPSDLLARLLISSKVVEPNDTVYGTAEVHSGNQPYTFTVDWGDGSNLKEYPGITEDFVRDETTYARQALEHSYSSEGEYNVTVTITDAAGKSLVPPLRDTIKVSTSKVTAWTADVRDIDTSEHEENIAFVSEPFTSSGVEVGRYTSSWSPTVDEESQEYFVKYRLPVPKNILSLSKMVRIAASVKASGIAAHDREFAFRTYSGKEYTAAIVDIDHTEDGYLRERDILTGLVEITRYPILVDDVKNTKSTSYSLIIEPSKMAVWQDKTPTTDKRELASLIDDGLEGEYISEIDITFKGNGIIDALILQYDKNEDGEFTNDEWLLLNTVDKTVDWLGFVQEQNKVIHKGKLYLPVESPKTGRVWLDRNLGASQVCNAYNNDDCYGDYYQWGRDTDGHEIKNSSLLDLWDVVSSEALLSDEFVRSSLEFGWDWSESDVSGEARQHDWGKIDGSSICPLGFYVPTFSELENELSTLDVSSAFDSFLKVPSAGLRYARYGNSLFSGKGSSSQAYLWTNSISVSNSGGESSAGQWFSKDFYNLSKYRADALPVRCIGVVPD